jgi:signal transduction histidine kinase
MSLGALLYLITLLGQAINSARATSDAIQVRIDLTETHAKLRKIEHKQTLEHERQRLMQDMHDGLGSSLISALRVVERGKMNDAEVALVLKGCIDDLKLAIDSMESVDDNLLLLLANLRFRLGPRLESMDITLIWQVENVPALDWLDPRNSLHILRILQEVFTNIIKHTNASQVHVATRTQGDSVVVSIADNGQGFEVSKALMSRGKGMSGQRSRAAGIGGDINWRSSHIGTCVSLSLPIKQPIIP